MSKQQPVPRLDLAPKIKRPLSLVNPLDYLLLFYWVCFFPQALRCYLDRFGNKFIPQKEKSWQEIVWKCLHENVIERQLVLQGVGLILVTWLALVGSLYGIGFLIYQGLLVINIFFYSLMLSGVICLICAWLVTKTHGVALGIASGSASGITSGIAYTFTIIFISKLVILNDFVSRVAFRIVRLVATIVENEIPITLVENIVTFSIQLGIIWGIAWVTGLGLVSGVKFRSIYGSLAGLLICILLGIYYGIKLGWVFSISVSISIAIPFIVIAAIAILRLEDWLLFLARTLVPIRNGSWLLPHVTQVPIPYLSSQLKNWLQRDWENGLYNANQLLAYTFQFIPVIDSINQVLAETPSEQVLFRVAQLAEAPYDWRLVRFASEKLTITAETDFFKPRLDQPARVCAAGFWYLHKKQPQKAVEVFAIVRSLPYGEELFTLAQALADYRRANTLTNISDLQIPTFPTLRSATWTALFRLDKVVKEIRIIDKSLSRYAKFSALNRALGELTNIVKEGKNIPIAEQDLILNIALDWQKVLLQVASGIGEISITEPVLNPYVVGDPVQGNIFVGREDIIRQLEEFWIFTHQLQSVILYGHRRMGKTSILLNAANCLGSGVNVVYVNLLRVGDIHQGVGEVLMAISDAASQTVNLPPPSDADLLNLPYRTFERYLKQIEVNLEAGLIIVLDEFEKIEELIESGKINKDFIGYLRGLVQMSPKIAFAFAGLHTLEEMTADYFQPFFASVIPIRVGFLERGATRQILANPDEDFPLDYKPEALDLIYDLTAGQPYLVQLVGFQLVRRYNDLVFEMGRTRDRVFTVEDVEEVVNDPEFFKRGRYYFDGVWGQTVQGVSGQQTILRSIAPYPEGLTINAIAQVTAIDEATIEEALNTLKRHDVVRDTEERWHIIVELFRRWVLDL